MKQQNYIYEAETGIATYVLEYDGQSFVGVARCAPDDEDMKNEYTGVNIAEQRAIIKLFKYRRNELKHRLAALNQLYYSVNKSKKYNSHGYMENMLNHQIANAKEDLEQINNAVIEREKYLKGYLQTKDDFYKHIRKMRNQDNNQ